MTTGPSDEEPVGLGVGYLFPHDFEGDDVAQQYLPDALAGRRYYVPNDQGQEATVAARMAAREETRAAKARRKSRPTPPMASMSDAIRPREEARKRIATTEKEDAGG